VNWKNNYRLEILLLLLTTIYLASSVINYLGQAPHWLLLAAASLLAVFFHARPKAILALLATFWLVAILHILGFPVFLEKIHALGDGVTAEMAAWGGIHDHPGPLTTLLFSLAAVFFLSYLQLFLASRGCHNWPLVLLGSTIYMVLWFQHYPRAETEFIFFLSLALPTLALFHLDRNSSAGKLFYKLGVLSLGLACATAVVFLPFQAPLYYREVFAYAREHMPALGKLQRSGPDLPEFARQPASPMASWTASHVGYSPGGRLGGSLTESTEPVMDLKLVEGNLPPSLYLRGQASDYYTGSSWKTSSAGTVEDLSSAFQNVELYQNQVKLHVSYLQRQQDLFGLFPTTEIQAFSGDNATLAYRVDPSGNIKIQDNGSFQEDYLLSGKTVAPAELQEKSPASGLEKSLSAPNRYLQLPEDLPPRIKQLSGDIISEAGADTDLEKARAIQEFLRQFPYSLSTPAHPPEKDFVDQFLFELQEGYCAYYASAMAVLLRTQDIPSRYVEGYRVPVNNGPEPSAGETNQPSIIQVQQKHAHAWVETYIQEYGWVVFEPTRPYEILESLGDTAAEDAGFNGDVDDAFSRDETTGDETTGDEDDEGETDEGEREGMAEDGQNGQEQDEAGDESSGETEDAAQEREEREKAAAEDARGADESVEDDEESGTAATTGSDSPPGDGKDLQAGEGTGAKSFPWIFWLLFTAALFLLCLWAALNYRHFQARDPSSLYREIVRLKSGFQHSPAPGETPGQVLAQLQADLPELAGELELLKHCYQVSSYSRSKNCLQVDLDKLRPLPLKTVRLYFKKFGPARSIKGLFKTFLPLR